jgi:MoaA/NifB/PqqE/SkfB family radical SAM enzyme
LKETILQAILTDDLSRASQLLADNANGLETLKHLLDQIKDKSSKPLANVRTPLPRVVSTSVSYTCGVGCKMCNAGFADKTYLFEDYKYLSPDQFDALEPWLENSSHVVFVGLGETLDCPHIEIYLNKIRDKISFLTTSGVPLNREKTEMLIRSGLKYINYSFDGNSTMGHGGGSIAYAKKFWEKVSMMEQIKQERGSTLPEQMLTIALNIENLHELNAIIETGVQHGMSKFMLSPMTPPAKESIPNTLHADYDQYKEEIDRVMQYWNEKGKFVRFFEIPEMYDESELCHFLDKQIVFELNRDRPKVCCGPLDAPLRLTETLPADYWNAFPFRYLRYQEFYKPTATLPAACEACWFKAPKKFGESLQTRFSTPPQQEEFHRFYQSASALKEKGHYDEAQTIFANIAESTTELSLKGKAWFHIGEMQLFGKNYVSAQTSFENAVHYCFDHQLAFAFLYLLYALNEVPCTEKPRRIPNQEFLDVFKELPKDRPLKTNTY